MNIIAKLTIDALKVNGTEGLRFYEGELIRISNTYEPPYGMVWHGMEKNLEK